MFIPLLFLLPLQSSKGHVLSLLTVAYSSLHLQLVYYNYNLVLVHMKKEMGPLQQTCDTRAEGQKEIKTTGRLYVSDLEIESQATAISKPVFLSLIQHGYVYSAFFNPYFECMQK